ncbi:ABC transporter ATP-binding protein [Kitasatospora sp. HPMI-4]|uniref:ABC transporter ATP-binding protein n=1 Tax=Kitasatospora sp. HPMI-4 TaxID=3448443 RepID=UPI003F1C2106
MPAIEITDLVREFQTGRGKVRRAVDNLSLSVEPGELFGLLGPNGAGKTTTIKILMTVLLPTSGRVRVAGLDVVAQPREVGRRLGVVLGGDRGLYDRLSARDNLVYFADLYGLDYRTRRRRVPELLERVGLSDRAGDRVEAFSRGMRQRLHIARGLLHDPQVVIMDEPSNGLDPVAGRDLRELVRSLTADGRTVLLTTHYMQEAEALCDRLAVIDHGRRIYQGTAADLKIATDGRQITAIESYGVDEGHLGRLRELPGVALVNVAESAGGQVVYLQTDARHDATAAALEVLAGLSIGRITVSEPTLEDAYLRLVADAAERGQAAPAGAP